jgi:nitrous oxidase accessory protein NosD
MRPVAGPVVGLVVLAAMGHVGSSEASITTIHVPADFSTIQSAIDEAEDGSTVLVSPGAYMEQIDFAGKSITVVSEDGPEVTMIDGNGAGTVVTFDSGETSDAVLSGFTIQHGFSDYGGGIRIASSSPTIRNNAIIDNVGCRGAGISVALGSPRIEDNVVRNNKWVQLPCVLGYSAGGGIHLAADGEAQIVSNTITDNSALDGGGGIWVSNNDALIEGNLIANNKVGGDPCCSDGGGLYLVNGADARIIQNLIVGNEARRGGGIYWYGSQYTPGPYLAQNTIASNLSTIAGSALYSDGFDAGIPVVNNILASPTTLPAVYCIQFFDAGYPTFQSNDVYAQGSNPYEGYCPDQTGVDENLSVDPDFVYEPAQNYHLRPGSPLVDSGNSGAIGLPIFDFDGDGRSLDGDADAVSVVDLGVDEYDPSTDLDQDGMPDALDNCAALLNYDQADLDGDLAGDACDLDDDGDGITDDSDNCPVVINSGQENGDGDSFGAACDNCPLAANGDQIDTDGDLSGDACDAPGSGNVDCDESVNAIDALKVLRHAASLLVAQNDPCLDIGDGPLVSGWVQGDADCSKGVAPVNSVDALTILRVAAGLPVVIPPSCPPVKPS